MRIELTLFDVALFAQLASVSSFTRMAPRVPDVVGLMGVLFATILTLERLKIN
jgi:hypothetical protein